MVAPFAKISVMSPISLAFNPKVFIETTVKSDASAREIIETEARFRTSDVPASICSVLSPD